MTSKLTLTSPIALTSAIKAGQVLKIDGTGAETDASKPVLGISINDYEIGEKPVFIASDLLTEVKLGEDVSTSLTELTISSSGEEAGNFVSAVATDTVRAIAIEPGTKGKLIRALLFNYTKA